ncbi:MAG: hypothetical protein ACOC6A_02940, partial [Chloroflexota bacterium]
MLDQAGDPTFPLWLTGDSEPTSWSSRLDTPLDPRHPARHSIWTSVADYMQDELFRRTRARLDTSRLSIRNVVPYRKLKPRRENVDWPEIQDYLQGLAGDVTTYQPEVILAIGRFGFEFARRAAGEDERRPYSYWNTQRLGEEFRMRLASMATPLVLPLLHVSFSARE